MTRKRCWMRCCLPSRASALSCDRVRESCGSSVLAPCGGAVSPLCAGRGSLLFAHFGVTGPCGLDLSGSWHRAEGKPRRVTLSFAPGSSFEAVEQSWVSYAAANPRRGVRTWLAETLPERVADLLTTESGLGGAAMS